MLLALTPAERDQIMAHCKHVEFTSGYTLYLAEASIRDIYFINSGLVSLIKTMRNGRRAEIGVIGAEGFVGLFGALGLPYTIVDYVIQLPVSAWSISTADMRQELARSHALHDAVHKYLFLFVNHMAQTAACNRLHSLRQRFCSWLLFAQDNTFADEFNFTHEFMADLLGVQRPSLSTVAAGLQQQGVISYKHGRIAILNRPALEKGACECYRIIRQHTAEALGT